MNGFDIKQENSFDHFLYENQILPNYDNCEHIKINDIQEPEPVTLVISPDVQSNQVEIVNNLDRCQATVSKIWYKRYKGFALNEVRNKPRCCTQIKRMLRQEETELEILRTKMGYTRKFFYQRNHPRLPIPRRIQKDPLTLSQEHSILDEIVEIDSDCEDQLAKNSKENDLEVSLMNEIIVSVNREVEKMIRNCEELHPMAIEGLKMVKNGMEILKKWCETTGSGKPKRQRPEKGPNRKKLKKQSAAFETVIIKEETR